MQALIAIFCFVLLFLTGRLVVRFGRRGSAHFDWESELNETVNYLGFFICLSFAILYILSIIAAQQKCPLPKAACGMEGDVWMFPIFAAPLGVPAVIAASVLLLLKVKQSDRPSGSKKQIPGAKGREPDPGHWESAAPTSALLESTRPSVSDSPRPPRPSRTGPVPRY